MPPAKTPASWSPAPAGARLVRAFNSVYFKTLQTEAHRAGDRVSGIPLAEQRCRGARRRRASVRDAGFERSSWAARRRAPLRSGDAGL